MPTTVDFALGFFGVWENTHASRLLTALPLGVAVAFCAVPGLVDLSLYPLREFFRPGLPREGRGGSLSGLFACARRRRGRAVRVNAGETFNSDRKVFRSPPVKV